MVFIDGRYEVSSMTDWCRCNMLWEAQEKAAKWDAIVRCGECSLCKESTIFNDEGKKIGVKHECSRPFMILKRGGIAESVFDPLSGVAVVLQQVKPNGYCAWGERRDA